MNLMIWWAMLLHTNGSNAIKTSRVYWHRQAGSAVRCNSGSVQQGWCVRRRNKALAALHTPTASCKSTRQDAVNISICSQCSLSVRGILLKFCVFFSCFMPLTLAFQTKCWRQTIRHIGCFYTATWSLVCKTQTRPLRWLVFSLSFFVGFKCVYIYRLALIVHTSTQMCKQS